MFENPHIIHILSKKKHEELLAECKMVRLANCLNKKNKKNRKYLCKLILLIADILIRIGERLKKRWAIGEEFDSEYIISRKE